MTPADRHQPHRPSWACAQCRAPWPCEPARSALQEELSPTRLALYTGSCLVRAAQDLPGAAPADLYLRFLAWIGTPRSSRPVTSVRR